MRCALTLKRPVVVGLLALLALGLGFGLLRGRIRAWREAREPEDPPSTAPLPPGARLLRELAYGADPRQRMDVWLPAGAKDAPVIFMVHGGAWVTGDKSMTRVVDRKLGRWLPRGIIFVSTNYRLLPDANPLEQSEDVARALAFAQGQAGEWGADPTAFVLMGHSAGAHLVSLLNSAPSRALALGARPWVGTVSLDTAAMDMVAKMEGSHERLYDVAFGADPAFWQSVSPIHQLSAGGPPLLAVCSSLRPDRPCEGTRSYADAARKRGLRVEVLAEPLKHGDINGELGAPGAYTSEVETFLATLAPAFRRLLGS